MPIEKYSSFTDEINLVFHFSSVQKMRLKNDISLLLRETYDVFIHIEKYVHCFLNSYKCEHRSLAEVLMVHVCHVTYSICGMIVHFAHILMFLLTK